MGVGPPSVTPSFLPGALNWVYEPPQSLVEALNGVYNAPPQLPAGAGGSKLGVGPSSLPLTSSLLRLRPLNWI